MLQCSAGRPRERGRGTARAVDVMAPPESDAASLRDAILRKLTYDLGKSRAAARERDWFMATALVVRDRVVERWLDCTRAAYETGSKQVYYLSLEFLVGRLLRDAMSNLGLAEGLKGAFDLLGLEFEPVREAEPDAALGNGGLGRLAACFMESLASLSIPAFGYGIRYEHGLSASAARWKRCRFPRCGCATPGTRPRRCRRLPTTRRWWAGAAST